MTGKSRRLTPMLLRKRIGLSQDKLATKLGVRRQTISDWETRKANPKLYPWEIGKMLATYKCTLEEFVEAFAEPATETKQADATTK